MPFYYYFFAPNGRFEACGMFTTSHIISASACILTVIALLFVFRKKFNKQIAERFLRITAIALTVLEAIKISHSFIHNELNLDAWFPLSYCGLFIPACWMAGFGKGKLKQVAEAFIAYGCPIAGVLFLIFPATSLMSFPIWHFLSLYSLLFHSVMLFTGCVQLKFEKKLNKRTYFSYLSYVLTFAALAIVLNTKFNSNIMNIRMPYNIPIQLLHDIYNWFQPAYMFVVIIIYMSLPVLTALLSKKLYIK